MSLNVRELRDTLAAHGPFVRIVVADVKGSTPREVGTSMYVFRDGQQGTIGGGTLEYEAAAKARAMLAQGSARRFDIIPLGPALGQCCGGAVSLFSERMDHAFADHLPAQGHWARPVSDAKQQSMAVQRHLAQMRNGLAPAEARFIDGWFIEPVAQSQTSLWIFGAGHVGRALVSVLSPLPDFRVTWVDTSADRFPDTIPEGITQLVAANPADVVRFAPEDAQHLILTYSHALDLELCHRLLEHGFSGAGLIGSSTKWARFRKRLADLGHSEAQISRICCPIGRPALGKHPQAIAIGVAEGLISSRAADVTTAKGAIA